MEQACFLITLVKLNPMLNNSTTKDMYHLFALLWFWFKLSVTAGSYSENKENLAPVCYSSTLRMTSDSGTSVSTLFFKIQSQKTKPLDGQRADVVVMTEAIDPTFQEKRRINRALINMKSVRPSVRPLSLTRDAS